jgi:cytochrome c-type biogenesis protein CcmH
MTTFVLLAAVLTIAGVALVAIPLLRTKPADTTPAPWAALVAAGVLAVGSSVLYVRLTNWSWHTSVTEDTPQTMVARLARRLEQNPDNLEGWLMLGRSYTELQEYPLSVRAFERADRLAGGKSTEALIGEAEALARSDENELDGRAAKLIEQALAVDPNSGKALFFGAAVAMRKGNLPLARERFARLMSLDPPDNIKPLLQKQIDSIDQQLAAGGGAGAVGQGGPATGASAAGSSGTAAVAGARPPGGNGTFAAAPRPGSNSTAGTGMGPDGNSTPGAASGPDSQPAADPNARVRINVTLAPTLAQSAATAAPLFVFVRDPARPGPPLAVKRLESHFPQTVELTASDSMMPGRAIAAGQKVQVVARIARSGNPVGASGDPVGESAYQVGRDGLVNIVIDHVMP